MYRDVKKKLLSVALCVCMIIGMVQVVPKAKAAEGHQISGGTGGASKTYTVVVDKSFTYNGQQQVPGPSDIRVYEGTDVTDETKRITSGFGVELQQENANSGISAGTHNITLTGSTYGFTGLIPYEIKKATIIGLKQNILSDVIPWSAGSGGVAPDLDTLDVMVSPTESITLSKSAGQFTITPTMEVGFVKSKVVFTDAKNFNLDVDSGGTKEADISFTVAYDLGALTGSPYEVEFNSAPSGIYDGNDHKDDISLLIKKGSKSYDASRNNFTIKYYKEETDGNYVSTSEIKNIGKYKVELCADSTKKAINEESDSWFMDSVSFPYEVTALGRQDIKVYATGIGTGEQLIFSGDGSGTVKRLVLQYQGPNTPVFPEPGKSLRVVANGTDITSLCKIEFPDKDSAGNAAIEIEPLSGSNVNCSKITVYYTIQSGIVIQSLDFNGRTMTADNNKREYNGLVQVPDNMLVTDQAGNELSASDYTCKYQYEDQSGEWQDSANPQSDDNFKSAGNKKVIVTGVVEYLKDQTYPFVYEIERKQLNSSEFSLVIHDSDCVYNGMAQQPGYEITYNGNLITGDHFQEAWDNNVNAGSGAKLTLIAKDTGNFDGQISKTFTIKKLRLSNATIDTEQVEDGIPCITYNRNAVNPTFKIGTYKMQAAEYRIVDYFDEHGVKLENPPTNVGVYSVTIENQDVLNNITGATNNIPFKIVQEDIGNVGLALKVNAEGVEWNGGTIIPELKDTLLEEGTDYSLDYEENDRVTLSPSSGAAVVITGNGNYKGTLKLYFKILPRQMTNRALAATGSAIYNGGAYDIQLDIRDIDRSGYALTSSTDYDITEVKYSEDETSWTALGSNVITNLPKAGLYRITVEGKGNYSGSRVIEVSCGVNLSKSCKVNVSSAYRALSYNGEAQTPAAINVVNTEKNNTVIPTDAYEVTYVRADGEDTLVNVGKVYVVATGDPSKGYFGSTAISDEVGCYYEITPAKWTVNGNKKYQVQINTHGGVTYNPNGTFVPDAAMGDITVQYNNNPNDSGGWKPLTYNTDYTVEWIGDPQTAGTKKIIITGKGNYEAVSINQDGFSYVVEQLDISKPESKISVDFINPNLSYADNKPPIKVTYDNDYILTPSVGNVYNDYSYTVSGGSILLNPSTGKYEVTYVVRGYGNYTGVKIETKEIDKTSFSGVTIFEVSDNPGEGQFYVVWNEAELLIPDVKNPQQVKPENFSLKYNPVGGGNPVTLKKGTDYEVTSWGTNIEPGTKDGANHVSITGKGGYEGTTDIVCTLYLDINQTVIKGDLVSGSAVSAAKFWDAYDNNNLKSLVSLELETSAGVWETIPDTCYEVELDGTRESGKDFGPQTIKITGNKSGTYCFASIKRTMIETTGDLDAATVIINGGNPVQFHGVAVTGPGIIVQMGNSRLIEGIHYKIDQFINNETIGTATVVIEGLGLYRGTTKSQDFDIVCDLSNASIFMEDEYHIMQDISSPGTTFSYAYTNNGVKPQIQVYLPNHVMLTQAASYELAYTNEMSAGVAKVTITPLANSYLTGSQEISYTIRKTNIAPVTNGAISIDYDGEVTYTGNRITADDGLNLMITDSNCTGEDHILKEGRDYDVTYQSNNHTNVTDKSYVIIRAKGGNYEGTYTFDFKIVPKNLNDGDITEVNPSMVYTGALIEPDIKLHQTTGLEKDLVLGQDYQITGYYDSTGTVRLLEAPKEPGTYQVEVEGLKNYYSTRKISYQIEQKDLGSDIEILFINSDDEHCTIDASGALTCVYDGREHVPGVKVKYLGMVLDPAEYTVKVYQKEAPGMPAIEAGIAVVEIQATGNRFTGSATREFEIKPRDIADALIDYQGIENDQKFAFIDGVQAINPSVTVIDKGIIGTPTLSEYQDYEIKYKDYNGDFDEHRYAGEVFMTFTGKGNYKGSKTYNFYIGEDISKSYTLINGQRSVSTTYNGLVQTPDEKDITVVWEADTDSVDQNKENRYNIAYYNEDFSKTVSPSAIVNAGKYYISVVGVPSKGTYAKSSEANSCVYTINPRSIAPAYILVSGYDGTYYYTGQPIQPQGLSVEDTDLPTSSDVNDPQRRSVKLTYGTDYELSYSNNVSAGKASIIVTGKGNYTGSRTAYFNIISSNAGGNNTWDGSSEGTGSISNGTTTIAASDIILGYDNSVYECMMYNGYERIPTVNIAGISNNEFIITASNNIRPGIATLTITGRGNNFTGTIIKNYKIKADLSYYGTIATIADQVYSGYQITPHVTLTCGGNLLNQGSDYTVTYLNNVNVGKATVMATATSDSYYIGSTTGSFNISNTAGGMEITGYGSAYTYTGYPIAPDVVVTMNGRVLNRGTDYTVTYSNNTNVGTATMTVTGIGSFSGTKTITYAIEAKNIENCLTTAVTSYQYTGSTYTPSVTVTDSSNGKTLVAGTDYTITYSNNTNPGTASITVTALSKNYTGTKVIPFKITSAAVSGLRTSTIKNNSIKLAWSAQDYADGYQICNSSNRVVATTNKNSYTVSGLTSCTTYKFKVRSYVENADGSVSYGNFSTAVSAKTLLNTPKLTAKSTSKGKVTLTWTKVSKATGYEIYYSTKKDGIYTRLKTVSKSSSRKYVDSGLASGEKYYYTIRAYRTSNGVKTYSNYNTIKSVKVK